MATQHQLFSVSRELGRRKGIEGDYRKLEKQYINMRDAYRDTCRERDTLSDKLNDVTTGETAKRTRTRAMRLVIVLILLATALVGTGFSVVRNTRYRSLVRDIKGTVKTVPYLVDGIDDSVRYRYEDLTGEKW